MALIRATTADDAASPPDRPIWRSSEELAMRDAVERWGRAKWPLARVCHELVMGRGEVRADLAFVSPDHLAVAEIKSSRDNTNRLINQAAMFRLATPEVWICAALRHVEDCELVRFLLPSIGVAATERGRAWGNLPEQFEIATRHDAGIVEPHPAALLALLWVDELICEARRHDLIQTRSKWNHASLVKVMLRLEPAQRLAAVCRQLRARQAFWRADPPIETA